MRATLGYPGNRFFWALALRQLANSLIVNQAITTGNFNMLWMAGNGSNVFDANCVGIKSTITQSSTTGSSGTIRVNWNAVSAGVYYIGLKFDAKSFKGLPLPTTDTVHFDFAAVGIAGSARGLDLVKRPSLAVLVPNNLFIWSDGQPTDRAIGLLRAPVSGLIGGT